MMTEVKQRIGILRLLWLCVAALILSVAGAAAQNRAEAKKLLDEKRYAEAVQAYEALLDKEPNNLYTRFGYAVACVETGQAAGVIPYLEEAVKRRLPSGQLYLGKAYLQTYRFQQAIDCLTPYLQELKKRRSPTEEAEALIARATDYLRMLKGVEKVQVIDSVVVDKEAFLQAYKPGHEAGRLERVATLFAEEKNAAATLHITEIGDKLYQAITDEDGAMRLAQRTALAGTWNKAVPLPQVVNGGGNVAYPFLAADGTTLYYATDAQGMGGYDIFVTRYNAGNGHYLVPQNVGMPFNSPANDYMYVVDEFNRLGWFATDRRQPEGKVCVYVFIPNETKITYSYEDADPDVLAGVAMLRSIKETWFDPDAVEKAQQRLARLQTREEKSEQQVAFSFVLDDKHTYTKASDFRSPQAYDLFQSYLRLKTKLQEVQQLLRKARADYAQASDAQKRALAPGILNMEQACLQMSREVCTTEKAIRKKEKSGL